MIAVQTVRLETTPIEAIQTNFGSIWLIRMVITIVLLGSPPRLAPRGRARTAGNGSRRRVAIRRSGGVGARDAKIR